MNALAEKYSVPEETIVKMVRDGVISASIYNYAEIASYFSLVDKPAVKAAEQTAEHFRVKPNTVWKALRKFR